MTPAAQLEPEAHVRAMWSAYQRGGPKAVLEMAPQDTEWQPLAQDAESISVVAHGFETHRGHVLAHGSLRVFRHGGFIDVQPSWVFFYEDRRLRRAIGYPSREAALEAIEQAA